MKNSLENIFELKAARAGGGGGGRDSPYSGITFNTANFEKRERAGGDAEKSSSSNNSKKADAYSRQDTAHPDRLKPPDAGNGVGNDSSYNIHSPHGSSTVSK